MNLAEALNLHCPCDTLEPAALRAQLDGEAGAPGFAEALAHTHPHLFSSTLVFLNAAHREAIEATMAAIERVATLAAGGPRRWRWPTRQRALTTVRRACSWATTSTWGHRTAADRNQHQRRGRPAQRGTGARAP